MPDHSESKLALDDPDMQEWMMDQANPLMGQVTFLLVSALLVTRYSLGLFRYRMDSAYYTPGEALADWNPWKVANLIESYGMLTLGAAAFVTELLSLFGIAAQINYFVWVFGVGIGGVTVALASVLFRLIAYDKAYSLNDGTMMSVVHMDAVQSVLIFATSALALFWQRKNWMMAQWLNLDEETRAAMMAMEEGEDEDEMVDVALEGDDEAASGLFMM